MSNLKNSCEDLYGQLLARLRENEPGDGTLIQNISRAVRICSDFLDQLKALVNGHTFIDKNEEIHFFKVIKPRFSSQSMYYTQVLKFHAKWPSASTLQKMYVTGALRTIAKHGHNNSSFKEYYLAEHTHHDEQYFIRASLSFSILFDAIVHDMDRTFCTSHDGKVAEILALQRFERYLQDRLDEIIIGTTKTPVNPDFTWAAQKTDFVEHVYGMHEMQPFKKRLTVKEIAEQLGKFYNIKVDEEIYRIYADICRRKTDRTKFLSEMIERLKKRMDKDSWK